MALRTTVEAPTKYGTTVPELYWRWTETTIRVLTYEVVVLLRGYASQDAFLAQAEPVAERALVLAGEDFMLLAPRIDGPAPEAISDVIYDLAKTRDPYFADAEVV